MKPDPLLAILCEDRLLDCGGDLYSLNAFGTPHWRIYAETFPNLAIVARVEQGARPATGEALATSPSLALRPIPIFQGPLGLLRKLPVVLPALRRALRGLAAKLSECLARPESLASMSERNLLEARKYTDGETDPIRRSFYRAFRSLI